MTDEDANDIIENVMKAHWPKWEFAGQELRVWIEELRKFDYETAKTAINELYKAWESPRYPKMPIVIGNIRKLAKLQRRAESRLVQLFTICKQDGKRRWFPFTGDANAPREEVTKRAEFLAAEANRLWPEEKHIIHYHGTEKVKENNGQESQDDIPF